MPNVQKHAFRRNRTKGPRGSNGNGRVDSRGVIMWAWRATVSWARFRGRETNEVLAGVELHAEWSLGLAVGRDGRGELLGGLFLCVLERWCPVCRRVGLRHHMGLSFGGFRDLISEGVAGRLTFSSRGRVSMIGSPEQLRLRLLQAATTIAAWSIRLLERLDAYPWVASASVHPLLAQERALGQPKRSPTGNQTERRPILFSLSFCDTLSSLSRTVSS
ncbi:hypothetical protein F5883DRAFT_2750 [Diaporthe sp. PMI_573]|nr:hypothetical protein F5883DRAFT_2750 [Diaporthaceae sp. PMI_573]